jgi:phage tail sheath gpL-like
MPVQFSTIPANLRVPLFYAEINAGQSPYSGPSRLLLIGQKLAAGSAVLNTPIRLDGNEEGLMGAGSMLAKMAIWARQNHLFGEIWMLPIDDPSGANQTFTVTVAAGIAGKTGTAVLYVAGERIEVAVAPSDDEDDVAANLVAAIGEGYVKFGRPLSFPVTAAAADNVVTLLPATTRTSRSWASPIRLRLPGAGRRPSARGSRWTRTSAGRSIRRTGSACRFRRSTWSASNRRSPVRLVFDHPAQPALSGWHCRLPCPDRRDSSDGPHRHDLPDQQLRAA